MNKRSFSNEGFLTSEDCARCGKVCGEGIFCLGCVIEALEWKPLMEVK